MGSFELMKRTSIDWVPNLPFTVIIPAHNEEAVIARCLDVVRTGAPDDHAMQIIVAANGCHDRTVEIVSATAPEADIVEIAKGSKTAAINAANGVARHAPRLYLDADVECDFTTLSALAEALSESGTMIAAPTVRFELSRTSPGVRAYYRVWLRQPFAEEGKGGAGCYGLSEAALGLIGPFPDIIADDTWIHTRFSNDQRRVLEQSPHEGSLSTKVHPPRTLAGLVKVEARKQIGNRELHREHPPQFPIHSSSKGGVMNALRSGASLPDLAVFVGIKFAAKLVAYWRIARGQTRTWARDPSSREL